MRIFCFLGILFISTGIYAQSSRLPIPGSNTTVLPKGTLFFKEYIPYNKIQYSYLLSAVNDQYISGTGDFICDIEISTDCLSNSKKYAIRLYFTSSTPSSSARYIFLDSSQIDAIINVINFAISKRTQITKESPHTEILYNNGTNLQIAFFSDFWDDTESNINMYRTPASSNKERIEVTTVSLNNNEKIAFQSLDLKFIKEFFIGAKEKLLEVQKMNK